MKKFFSQKQKEKTANTLSYPLVDYKSVIKLVVRYYSEHDVGSVYTISYIVECRYLETFNAMKEKKLAEIRQKILDIKTALNTPDDFLLICNSLIINKKKFINAVIEIEGD